MPRLQRRSHDPRDARERVTHDAKARQPGLSAIDEMVGRTPRLKRPGPKRKKLVDNEQDIPAVAAHISRCTSTTLNHRLWVNEREEYARCYRLGPGAGGFDLAHLEGRAPFIASELRRQGQLVRGDS